MTEIMPDPPPELTFYHTVEFAPGRKTAGWPVIVPIVDMIVAAMRELDFHGKKVLDIGCRDGALSFEAEKLGASSVLGIDFHLPIETIAFLKQALQSAARFEQHNLYGLSAARHGVFDIILLPGVVYHLRYPFSGLRLMRDLVVDGGILLVETATFTDANRLPLLLCPTGADSPYEPSSCSFYNIKGFTDTMRSLGFALRSHRSLLNLPPHDPDSSGPLPIDRTVFVCVRDRRLDDPFIMGYWDGDSAVPDLPGWVAQSG